MQCRWSFRILTPFVVLSISWSNRILAAPDDQSAAKIVCVDQLVRMNRCELDELYRSSPAATIPDGNLRGTAIAIPGSKCAPAASKFSRVMWQGKTFCNADGQAVNKFFGLRCVRAQVSTGESWMDGKPALILDYRQTSLVYGKVRDEIRQVAHGIFLGAMYVESCCGPEFKRYFVLELETCCCE